MFYFPLICKGKNLSTIFLEIQTRRHLEGHVQLLLHSFSLKQSFLLLTKRFARILYTAYLETLISAPYLLSVHLLTVSERVRSTLRIVQMFHAKAGLVSRVPWASNLHTFQELL